jgi:plastocyanin
MTSREQVNFGAFVLRAAVAGIAVCTLLALPALARAAQGNSVTPATQMAKVEGPQVTIDNFTFSPATLTVPSGTTVTWTNQDDMVHTVTETNRSFSSKGLETGDTYSHTFTAPGTYTYFCALHPRMTATVVVK